MKIKIRILAFLLAWVTTSVCSPKQASAQPDDVSLQVFYDELSPYGEWVESAQYGYVWIPDVGPDFMPYSSEGRWISTDYGWTWVSDYEWGWAPFHYGRWDYDNYYGWLWVPDYEWGPSWVTWRSARGYYGWQPMRPGVSISLSFGNDYYNNYNDYWMFVSDRDFQRSNVSRYYVNQRNRDRIIRNSTVINNTYIDNRRNSTYISGPARDDVQRTTGKRVNSVVIRENNRPGQELKNGQLQIYRPDVRKNTDSGQKPVPARITSREDIKRPLGRNAVNQQRIASPTNNGRQQQQNTINQQNTDNKNTLPATQQKVNQAENDRQQQKQQRRQNIDKGNAQREQQQKINQSENNRQQQQQRQNTINQQNIDKGNTQREQEQKVNQSENNRRQQQNIDKNNAQPAQQQKVDAPKNNVREQRQVDRQEKSVRNKQEKENRSQENKNR